MRRQVHSKEGAIDEVGMLRACGSGKAIICIHPGSMYRKEETRNDGKARANCRLFITDDVLFAR